VIEGARMWLFGSTLRRMRLPLRRSPLVALAMTGATNAWITLAGLASGSLLARILGPEGRGELAAIQLWAGLVATFGLVGLPSAIIYLSGRKPAVAGVYCATAVALAIVPTTGLTAVAYLLLPQVLRQHGLAVVAEARLYLIYVLPAVVGGIALTALQAQLRLGAWNAMRATFSALWLFALACVAASATRDPWHVAVASLLLVAFTALVYWITLLRSTPGPYVVNLSHSRTLLQYALPSAISILPQQSVFKLDQLLMASLLAPRTLGLYAVAVTWSSALAPVAAAVSDVAFPYLARAEPGARRTSTVSVLLRLTVTLNVCVALALASITPFVLPLLFGRGFADAVPMTWILVGASALAATKAVMGDTLRGLGRPQVVMFGELAGFASSAVLLLTLLHDVGALGAAIFSLVGYAVTFAWLLVAVVRATGLPVRSLLVLQRADLLYLRARIGVGRSQPAVDC
jgi:enterobacterial common antigen flippase